MAMSRSRGGTLVTSRPPMTISPPEVSSSPAMQLRSVDLPQPDGPTRTRKSPRAMSILIDFSTSTEPKRLTRLRISSTGTSAAVCATAAMLPFPFGRKSARAGGHLQHQSAAKGPARHDKSPIAFYCRRRKSGGENVLGPERAYAGMVARRGDLSGLSALLSGYQRRWRRRPARDHARSEEHH